MSCFGCLSVSTEAQNMEPSMTWEVKHGMGLGATMGSVAHVVAHTDLPKVPCRTVR